MSERADELDHRDSFADIAPIPSRLVFSGRDADTPLVTIAIPTFRRADMLAETVRSALRQRCDGIVEVIVLDNDPDSVGAKQLAIDVPEIATANFRYWVHTENLGMYGNHNRAVDLARGTWLTILHDDDLLDDDFLDTLMTVLARRSEIDAIVCRKRYPDERALKSNIDQNVAPIRQSILKAVFASSETRRIKGRHLFFWVGGAVGNVVGLLLKRADMIELGGFRPEQGFVADCWFYARLARARRLYQHAATLASVRIAVNESSRPETLFTFLTGTALIQAAMCNVGFVPRSWMRLRPLIIERMRVYFERHWHVELPRAEVERRLGFRLSADRPIVHKALRLLLRGY